MIESRRMADPVDAALLTVFRRLFESEFVTLEGFAISCRAPEGLRCLDESVALARLLGDGPGGDSLEPGLSTPESPEAPELHRSMLAAWPDFVAVVSGPSRHLRALMAEGFAMPAPTSMMRKRGITHLEDHVVDPAELTGSALGPTLLRARQQATANGMKHVLLVEPDGTVHVAGPTLEETMAHYSNVEFSARVECIRIEEQAVERSGA